MQAIKGIGLALAIFGILLIIVMIVLIAVVSFNFIYIVGFIFGVLFLIWGVILSIVAAGQEAGLKLMEDPEVRNQVLKLAATL